MAGPGEIFKLLMEGSSNRNTNSTRMNATSSRSHAVFTMVVEHSQEDAIIPDKTNVTVGKLHLVDLVRHTTSICGPWCTSLAFR